MAGVDLLFGGWLGSPAIKSLVERAKYFRANYEVHKDARRMVDTLTTTLALCQETMEAADRTMIKSPKLATWLKNLKGAVYEADDVLDDMEAKSIKKKIQGSNKVSEFAFSSLNVIFDVGVHKRLKNVVAKLTKISDESRTFDDLVITNEIYELNNYGLRYEMETNLQPLGEVGLYGRQEELNVILETILRPKFGSCKNKGKNHHGPYVLPVVGMGGIGKTALAQRVYNNSKVQQTFEAKAWISISYNLDVKLLMLKLSYSLREYQRVDVRTSKDCSENLSMIIDGVRFLIVLDDTCERIENQWDHLYTTLSHGAPGCVLLITTRNGAFANRVATFDPILLNPLDWGVFWELFKKVAFGNKDIVHYERNRLEQIGRKIACQLNGLPLAAKIIGGILRSKIDVDKWRIVSKSEWWDMHESTILPFIRVSYQHLNPCLRDCFAYCSLFPQNSLIDKEKLVQMWLAQNFIPQDSNDTRKMEEIGRVWFDKLVERSFFLPAWDNKGYVMPSLMRDLAVTVSANECFYLTDHSNQIPHSVRHLAVDTQNLEWVKWIRKCKNLRSFLFFGLSHVVGIYSAINDTLYELDKIRVLDLSYLHVKTKYPPRAIQKMRHLRFLNLSSTGIKELTHSRFDHYHLQALHIRECSLIKVPKGLNKLINLRHLNADVETISLISGIGKLTNLQELDEYRVATKEGNKITELKYLRELTGHLRITNCENIRCKEEAAQAKLIDKKKLQSVEICWSSASREADTDMDIIECLEPCYDIKELTVKGYMGSSFPDWIRDMSHFLNLKTIRVISCINIEVLPTLGQPPSLSTLEFVDNLSLKKAPLQCFSASLKALKIVGCHNLKSLAESLPHLTSLSLLHIINYKMKTSLNINSLTLLEDLIFKNCPELSIEGDLQSLTSNLRYFEITRCPKLLRMIYSMSIKEGEDLLVC